MTKVAAEGVARLPLAQGIIDPVFYSKVKVREDLRVAAEGL